MELSQRQLHVKERHPTKDGHQNIGNEEGTCGETSESWSQSWCVCGGRDRVIKNQEEFDRNVKITLEFIGKVGSTRQAFEICN